MSDNDTYLIAMPERRQRYFSEAGDCLQMGVNLKLIKVSTRNSPAMSLAHHTVLSIDKHYTSLIYVICHVTENCTINSIVSLPLRLS
jgi:hypothetical protein